MKTLALTINLTFSEKVNTDEDINEIGENIRQAIAHAADTAGIAPEGSDAYLKEFSITCPWSNLEINHVV